MVSGSTLQQCSADLQVAGSDPLHLEILTGVACQLEHLSSEVLQDSRAVNGGRAGRSVGVRVGRTGGQVQPPAEELRQTHQREALSRHGGAAG